MKLDCFIGPDGTTTTVTSSPVSVPPGSVLFIKQTLSTQITGTFGGDESVLGTGGLFTTDTSSGSGFTALFYDFGRIINSDELTISGYSFTGGTATFTVSTSVDADILTHH